VHPCALQRKQLLQVSFVVVKEVSVCLHQQKLLTLFPSFGLQAESSCSRE
jgi:hypothetical protein